MRPVFGSAVTASDVERLTSEQGEKAFVRLCATLIASAIGEAMGDFAVPNWSERINVPDRGVDGEFTGPHHMLEAGGLVGPGGNVYQFKWRRLGTRPARSVIQELRKSVTGAVRDILSKGEVPLNRYVLMVNVDLSRADRATLSQALRKDCPEFNDRPLIIWGAAEIAAALNSHPHIRHAFFSGGVFCTLDIALEELRRRYEAVGWSDFVGYEEHVRSIQDFAKKPGGRLLLVTGLPYSGKTRMVIEALRPQAARVAWASDPSVVTEDHLRALDTAPGGSLAVLDNTDANHLETFERWARSRSHLKTILISRQSLAMPDVPVVKLEGLSDKDTGALFGPDSQKLPHLMKDWISRLGGNNPGLILYALAAQRELPERPVLESERERPRWVIGALLRRSLLANLPPDELEALQVLTLLPQVGTEGEVKGELATIAAVLKRDEVRVRQAIPSLEERHLLFCKGRFVEVAPELLANELASEVFKVSKEVVAQLWLGLSDPARNRLLRRLLGLSDNPDVATLFDEFFSESGWFRTLDDLREQAHRFRLITQARPRAALRALQRLLGDLDASTLRDSIAGDLRREIVWSLEPLALRAGTFSGAADLLLRLAETENENIANNATGVFLALFHWHHPEVSVPHSDRIDFLKHAAGSDSPSRRMLVARAAGQAVAGQAVFWPHHGEGMSLPEKPARLPTWGDVWEFHASILRILRQLLKDPEREVRETAFHAVLESVREMVRLSVLEDGIHSLAEECFGTLKDLAGRELGLVERSELRSTVSLIEEDIRRSASEAAQAGRGHEGASIAQEKLKSIRLMLEDESFEGQLTRWVGPRAWGDDNADVEAADRGETEPSTRRISELAAKACENPRLLDTALMDWMMTDEAKHAAPFFIALGGLDSAGVWQDPIIERLGTLNGPWAFGWYVKGVANRSRARAEEILDRLSLDSPAHVRGILSATFFLPATPGNVERLLSLVDRRLASPTEITSGIRYGGWVKPLSTDVFTILVKGLDDGTTETAAGLIELLASWLYFSKEMTAELQERAWSLLERSMESDNRQFAYRWDRVAVGLAARQPQRFFDLLQQLARGPDGLESAKTLAVLLDDAAVWKKLRELDRTGVLLTLFRLEAEQERSPFWVSWCLEHFVDPDTDGEILAGFAIENGEAGALAVANVLDARGDGFWTIAAKLIETFPKSERLLGRLSSKVGTTGAVLGSLVPTWRHRLDRASGLLNHSHPGVSRWAREVVDGMEDNIRREEKQDQERFIWDYWISRRQLEDLLKKQDSPDRLWAIRRILRRAATKDVLELLSLEEIREGLSTADLSEAERKKWEAYLAHWSHRG